MTSLRDVAKKKTGKCGNFEKTLPFFTVFNMGDPPTINVSKVLKCKINHNFFLLKNMTFPNGGEGGPRLGKIPTFSRFFYWGASLMSNKNLAPTYETFERFKTNTWENVYELKKTRSLDPKNKDHSLRYLRFITILFCDCKKRLSLLLKLLSHQGENFQCNERSLSVKTLWPRLVHTPEYSTPAGSSDGERDSESVMRRAGSWGQRRKLLTTYQSITHNAYASDHLPKHKANV